MENLLPIILAGMLAAQIGRAFWNRFRAEHERQEIITRPRTVARVGYRGIIKAPGNSKGDERWLPELIKPYTYYLRGKERRQLRIAPGDMQLNLKQKETLQEALRRGKRFNAFVEPNQRGRTYLTPGPPLFSWSYIMKVMAVIGLACGLMWWIGDAFALYIIYLAAAGILKAQLGEVYVGNLAEYLEPANLREAQTQDAEQVEEAMELRELDRIPKVKEKIKL